MELVEKLKLKENKECRIELVNLEALIKFLDVYPSFEEDLLACCKTQNDVLDLSFEIFELSRGNPFLLLRKSGSIYKKYRDLFDSFNDPKQASFFVVEFSYETALNYRPLYDYLMKNRDKLGDISKVIERLKALGFEQICFRDGVEIIPEYQDGKIIYGSSTSPYKIWQGKGSCPTIVLNSLTFDADRLPETLNKGDTFDKIVAVSKNYDGCSRKLKEAIELSIGIDNVDNAFRHFSSIVSGLDNNEDKERIVDALVEMGTLLDNVRELSDSYSTNISGLSHEDLQRQKQFVLEKRKNTTTK